MTQIRSGGGAPTAVLAGSLAIFPLLDVLGFLARTRHAGELQVVADGVEARLRVDGGDLLDHPATAADRLFELACLDDAWFTVSAAPAAPAAPAAARREQTERIPLEPLLERVAPHVAEWQSLMKALPFEAVARMSPVMPGPEAQIRSDQWRVLSLVGTGRPVHEVVDVSDGRPLETLRLIHELAQKELIVVDLPTAGERPEPEPVGVDDEVDDHAHDHAHDHAALGGELGDAVPMAAARATTTPLTAKRTGTVRVAVPEPTVAATTATTTATTATEAPPAVNATPAPDHGDGATTGAHQPDAGRRVTPRSPAPPRRAGHHAVAAYMPPPVTPSFWPVLDASAGASGDHGDGDAVAAAALVADAALAAAAPDAPPPAPAAPDQSA